MTAIPFMPGGPNPPAGVIVAVIIIMLLMCFPLVVLMWGAVADRKRKELQKKAEASAYTVEGTVARFGTESACDGYVDYAVQLEGAPAVYRVCSTALSAASHGELTKPGDFVSFQVLPGLPSVRNFYNAATAKA